MLETLPNSMKNHIKRIMTIIIILSTRSITPCLIQNHHENIEI